MRITACHNAKEPKEKKKKVDKILSMDAGALAYPCAADDRGRC